MTFPGYVLPFLALSLGACTTLGSNVSGNWSCETEGDCPTTHEIDEQVLAGKKQVPAPVPVRSLQAEAPYAAATKDIGMPKRTGDTVGRIVIAAFIDDAGLYHDRAVIYAVMEEGGWQPAPSMPAHASDQKSVEQ